MANKPFFTSSQEIKSHSSALFNDRIGVLFYQIDQSFIAIFNNKDDINALKVLVSTINQLYRNIRPIIRMNPTIRLNLKLGTEIEGEYKTDVIIKYINDMVDYCDLQVGYSTIRNRKIIKAIETVDSIIRDALQLLKYFIRTDEGQKADAYSLSETYVDAITDEQLISSYTQKNND